MSNSRYNTVKRIICPECQGRKWNMYYNKAEDCQEQRDCETCDGEAIVIETRTIKSLKDA